jgi:alcohol dehydrogenase
MSFFNPVNITNKPGARSALLEVVQNLEVLVICSAQMLKRINLDNILNGFADLPNLQFEHGFDSNPSLTDMVEIAEKYSSKKIDLVVGIGGGSAMDVAKIASVAIPAMSNGIHLSRLLDDADLFTLFEAFDCMQVPTTAGTGSEVTPFATVWDYDLKIKKSLSHPSMFAKRAIIDSEFLYDIPINIALSTGLDALNQALESLWNVNATEITRHLSVRAVISSLNSLIFLEELNTNQTAAKNLATASLLAGLSISHTRTAICHSISYPLTLAFGLPHGLACGFSMLEVYNFNATHIKDDIITIEQQLNGNKVPDIIEAIYKKYDFYQLVRNHIQHTDSVLELLPQMVSPERADNNIRKFNQIELERIIRSSCLRARLKLL